MNKRSVAVIGAPLDLGAGRRGVDMGPSAVRVAGLGKRLGALGYDVADLGNVPVAQAESVDDAGPGDAKYLHQIAATCERLGELVASATGGRENAAGAWRRSLDRGRHGSGRLEILSGIESAKSACSGSMRTPI